MQQLKVGKPVVVLTVVALAVAILASPVTGVGHVFARQAVAPSGPTPKPTEVTLSDASADPSEPDVFGPEAVAPSGPDPLVTSTDLRSRKPSAETAKTLAAAAKPRVVAIVGLRTLFTPEGILTPKKLVAQRSNIRRLQDKLLSRLSGEVVVRRYASIPFMSLSLDANGVEQAFSNPGVATLEENTDDEEDLDKTTELIGVPFAARLGQTGTQRIVAVLDSGVDSSHAFLSGRVVEEACFSTPSGNGPSFCPNGAPSQVGPGSAAPCPLADETCGHGTHVAGIVAGRGSKYNGVAPSGRILAVQVFRQRVCQSGILVVLCAQTSKDDQVAGLEHVLGRRNAGLPIAAVNMSLGGSTSFTGNCDAEEAARKAAIDNLRSLRVATVITAGNDGFVNGLSAPACISTAVSVGATRDDDTVRNSSNSGPLLSLLAPGTNVDSSVPNVASACSDAIEVIDGAAFCEKDGTSMAAPHVAGAWALITSARRNFTVADVVRVLRITGLNITDTKSGITTPRLQLSQALACIGDIWVSNARALESSGVASFVVTRTASGCGGGGFGGLLSVTLSTSNLSIPLFRATAGTDYDARQETFALGAFQSATFNVTIRPDTANEFVEFFVVRATGTGITMGDSTGVGAILG